MNELQDVKLLREWIRQTLREDDAGDLYAGAVDAQGPYGQGQQYGSGADLYKTFVEPFTDVFKVAAGKTKELSVKTQTLGKVVFETIITTLIPIFSDDYNEIFTDEKKKIQRIQTEYREAYDAVEAAFDHDDVKLLAFMYDPFAAGSMLGYFGGKQGAKTAFSVVDALSGGWLSQNMSVKSAPKKRNNKAQYASGGGTDAQYESLLREANVSKDVLVAALDQPASKAAQQTAQEIVKSTLKQAHTAAKQVLTAGSLDQMMKSAGRGTPPEIAQKLSSVPEQERQNISNQIMKALKGSIKQFYIRGLQDRVDGAKKSGVPETSAFIKDHNRVISAIKAM